MQMGTPMLEQDETSDRQVRAFSQNELLYF